MNVKDLRDRLAGLPGEMPVLIETHELLGDDSEPREKRDKDCLDAHQPSGT